MERKKHNDNCKPVKHTSGIQVPEKKRIIIARGQKTPILVVAKSTHRLRMPRERAHQTQATFSIDRIDCNSVTAIHIVHSGIQSIPPRTHLLPSSFHANGVFL